MTSAAQTSPRPAFLPRLLVALGMCAAVLLTAHLLDGPVFRHVRMENPRRHDWVEMFRTFGYLPTSFFAAAAALCIDWGAASLAPFDRCRRPVWAGALLLVLAPLLSGTLDELLKLAVRRERPILHDGAYFFRSWSDAAWSTSNLGFPSSHAAVAFALAFCLCRLYPPAAPVWIIGAAGCALTRLLDASHFLSDCTGAAILAFGLVWACALLLPVARTKTANQQSIRAADT